jgi:hypothetical protein
MPCLIWQAWEGQRHWFSAADGYTSEVALPMYRLPEFCLPSPTRLAVQDGHAGSAQQCWAKM